MNNIIEAAIIFYWQGRYNRELWKFKNYVNTYHLFGKRSAVI